MVIYLVLIAVLSLKSCSGSGEDQYGDVTLYLNSSEPVLEGHPLSLTCVVENFTYLVEISWHKLSDENETGEQNDTDLSGSDRFRFTSNQSKSNTSDQTFTAVLQSAKYSDSGRYSCTVELNSTVLRDTLNVTVVGKPEIDKTLTVKNVILGRTVHIVCKFKAIPGPSNITWYGPDREILPNDTGSHKYLFRSSQSGQHGFTFLVITAFSNDDIGKYRCRVENSIGVDEHVIRLEGNRFVQMIPDKRTFSIVYRTSTSFRCMAANFPAGTETEMSWYLRSESTPPIKLHNFTYKDGCRIRIVSWMENSAGSEFAAEKLSELTVTNITYLFDGKLVCSATWDGQIYDASVNISVRGRPELQTSGTVTARFGHPTELVCNVTSHPPPHLVDWFFNRKKLDVFSTRHRIQNTLLGTKIISRLKILFASHASFGLYKCEAENDFGVQSAVIKLEEQADCRRRKCDVTKECLGGTLCVCKHGFRKGKYDTCIDVNECNDHYRCDQDCKNTPGSFLCACFAGYTLAEDGKTCVVYTVADKTMLNSLLVGVGIGISAIVIIAVAVLGCLCWRRRRDINKELISEEDSVFGSVSYSRHERLSEVDLYATVERSSDEFPRERLRFLEALGMGTFGAVYKAEALNITDSGSWETVAVKLCRECATDLDKEDLCNELAIVKKIPAHVNVVSFHGCCTVGEPLLLIMEYVAGGDLLDYLRKRRPENLENHVYENELTAKDLLSFALQSARGMAHLSHHSIVHRDVAARNVLIGANQICKISDFGLARDVEGMDIYERTSKGPLPIRWMAPESLTEGIHSHKSDVWSYGVLLWEIVTLGASPYSELSLKHVIEEVVAGKTLDKPQHCTIELYDLMCSCWFMEPGNRPDFSSICENLELLLELEADYIQLDQFQEHIYTVLEPDTMEERL